MKLLKNSLIYTVSILLQGGVVFLLLPMYTAIFSTTEYGVLAVITALTGFLVSGGFLSTFYLLSLHAAATRFYIKYQNEEETTHTLFSTLFIFIFILGIVLSVIFFMLRGILLEPLLKNIAFFPYIALGLIAVFFSSFYLLYQAILQAKQQGGKYGLVNLIYVLMTAVFIVLFLWVLKLRVAGVLLAIVLTNFIFFIYIVKDLFRTMPPRFDRALLMESLRYALPLVPHSLFAWGMLMVNKLLINHIADTASVGVYDIGFTFANLVNVLSWAINQAYVPWFFDRMKDKNSHTGSILKFAENAVLFYSLVALLISLFIKEVLGIAVTGEFVRGWTVVPLISFAYVFNGLYFFFVNGLFYNEKSTRYVPLCTLFSAALNIGLNVLLIPRYGIMGSAVATLISLIFSSVVVFLVSNRVEPIGFRPLVMYFYPVVFFGIALFAFSDSWFSPIVFFILKLALASLILGILSLIKKKEIHWFWQIVLQKLKKQP